MLRTIAILTGISCVLFTTRVHSQSALVHLEEEFLLKSGWQEFMPDAYGINDSTLLMVGLNNNMNTLKVNIFLRWITVQGSVLREQEIFHIDNQEGYSYGLASFYNGSTIDRDFLYVLAEAYPDSCSISGPMVRAYHLIKVKLFSGDIVKDTVMCLDSIRVFSDLQTSAQGDSLYFYGSTGYLNVMPQTRLSTMTKDFQHFIDHKIRSIETNMIPFGVEGDDRTVAGSHYRYDDDWLHNRQDIWFGRIEGDTILESFRMKYYYTHFLVKAYTLNENEKAFLGYSLYSAFQESSLYLFRSDTLSWNFYDAFYQELSDIISIGDHYCILQDSYREDDDRKDKIIMHYVDQDGFPYNQDEFAAPWILYSMRGLKYNGYYYVFVYIGDGDTYLAVLNGEIPIEEAQYEFTHVYKFKVHE